jgi:hypothetical protein
MARFANGSVRVEVDINEAVTALGAGDDIARMPHRRVYSKTLASGTADGEIDRVVSQGVSFTTTPTDIDLSGSLTSPLNAGAVVFAEVSMIYIENTAAAGNLQVGGDAASLPLFGAAADFIVVPPGGCFFWYAPAGIAITATTADILQIAASAGTVTGKVTIAGRSA